MRVFISLLMVVVVFSGSIMSAYADTVVGTKPLALLLIGLTMVALGVVWHNRVDFNYFTNDFYNRQTASEQTGWLNLATAAKGMSYVATTVDMYNKAKTYITSNFNQGTNKVGTYNPVQTWTGYPDSTPSYSSTFPYQVITTEGYLYMSTSSFYYSAGGLWTLGRYMRFNLSSNHLAWVINWAERTSSEIISFAPVQYSNDDIYIDTVNTAKAAEKTNSNGTYKIYTTSPAYTPTYDYQNISTGTKAVPFPGKAMSSDGTIPQSVYDTFVTKDVFETTYNDLITADLIGQEIDIPDLPDAQYWDDVIAGITGIGTLSQEIKTAIGIQAQTLAGVEGAVGVLTGELTGVKEIAGTISGDVSRTRTAVETLTDTETGTLDFTPLVVAGNTFTQVFPFSLPWDLYRLLDAIDSPPIDPVIHLNMPSIQMNVLGKVITLLPSKDWKIDMTPAAPYFAIWRNIELFAFIVILIMRTRTLMGGDV